MCERIGPSPLAALAASDFSRRSLLRAGATGALTIAVAGAWGGHAHAAESHIKSVHGSGFCNLNYFLTEAKQMAQEDGVILDFVVTPTSAEMVTFLGAGQVDAALIPYTSFIALYDKGAPVKIVGGGGIQGCVLVAQPGLDTPAKLKGKTLGTFQMDTLEVLPYDWLKKHNVSFRDINVRYMGNTPEAVEAFKAGALDMICTIEPYGTALLNDVKGSVMLSDGTDIYGKGYTDCVLAVRTSLIKENPGGIKSLIKGMLKAQHMAETQPEDVLKLLVGPYYKTSLENARIAMAKQPSVVDARSQSQFILDRVSSLVEMGYIKNKPGPDALDWSLLEQAIAESKPIYDQLKYKSAA
ncbi:MAG TPA: ABC transporter substrate-binding protein [Stellaceae bacterium]|nr:ABC transporter substrate-binding protein [Stellaceae bacterium]